MNKKEFLALLVKFQQGIVDTAKAAGRELEDGEKKQFEELQTVIDALKRELADEEKAAEITDPEATETAEQARAAERARIGEINSMCRAFGMDADKYINSDMTTEAVRAAIMKELMANGAPTQVSVNKDEGDKFRAAAVDGLVMRSGGKIEGDKPAAGADEFRGMSLRDLAIECLSREGENESELRRMDKTELFAKLSRQFFNPSAAFPVIMDQTIKKNIVTMYNEVPTTFEQITTSGTLSDFKTTADHNYVMGSIGDFELVPEGGELKASLPEFKMLPQRKLQTYGKQFSMTREAFVNDDIGFLSSLPGAYAKAAKKTINKQVYSMLINNAKIFDGKELFHKDHANLISAGTGITNEAIQAMIMVLKKQTDHFGDPIIVRPKKLVVPVGYGFTLAQIFKSPTINTTDNTQAYNPLWNAGFDIIEDPYINALAGTGAVPWFMLAEPSDAKGIQVDYLNGQKVPTIRRMEKAGQLGFTWDIYLDWGITAVDYRGIVKNPGVVIK